ncbi:MAG: ATP-binding protein [Patescibacteria group bacterium]
MIKRTILNRIIKNVRPGFVNIIYGPRRVGKTILLNQIRDFYNEKTISFNGDTDESVTALNQASEVKLSELVNDYSIIIIDEAQRIPGIGLSLKIIIDKFPNKKIFVTGSASLDLAKGVHESLAGRNISYRLFPLSIVEKADGLDKYKWNSLLDNLLVFGAYPYILQLKNQEEKISYLSGIIDDYLFKDVMFVERIDRPDIFKKLTVLLAWQIGQSVSVNELANNLQVDSKTITRYLDLLEKSFVIFGVSSYSKNLRKELSKSHKYYFYDLGIRNGLINQFMSLETRPDVGALWENFLFIERLKSNEYSGKNSRYYFWRNYQEAEIDFLEDNGTGVKAYEFKWGNKRYGTPKAFKDSYKIDVEVVNRDNYLKFLV